MSSDQDSAARQKVNDLTSRVEEISKIYTDWLMVEGAEVDEDKLVELVANLFQDYGHLWRTVQALLVINGIKTRIHEADSFGVLAMELQLPSGEWGVIG